MFCLIYFICVIFIRTGTSQIFTSRNGISPSNLLNTQTINPISGISANGINGLALNNLALNNLQIAKSIPHASSLGNRAATNILNSNSVSTGSVANRLTNGNLVNDVTNINLANGFANGNLANGLANANLINAGRIINPLANGNFGNGISSNNLINSNNILNGLAASNSIYLNGNTANFNIGNRQGLSFASGTPGNPPCGIQVMADALEIGGSVAVTGQMPVYGMVALNGNLPTDGTATVSYNCGYGVNN